jgi:uncharacterized protein YyaL (SSP411 family)
MLPGVRGLRRFSCGALLLALACRNSAPRAQRSPGQVAIPTFRAAVSAADSATWQRARPLLLAARRQRVQPAFDPKLVTAWNGLALTALAAGYRASGERRWREAAENAAKALWSLNRDASGELLRASDQGHPGSRSQR